MCSPINLKPIESDPDQVKADQVSPDQVSSDQVKADQVRDDLAKAEQPNVIASMRLLCVPRSRQPFFVCLNAISIWARCNLKCFWPKQKRRSWYAPPPVVQTAARCSSKFSGVRRRLHVRHHRRLHVPPPLGAACEAGACEVVPCEARRRGMLWPVLPAEHCYAKRERCREIGRRWRDRTTRPGPPW